LRLDVGEQAASERTLSAYRHQVDGPAGREPSTEDVDPLPEQRVLSKRCVS